MYTPFPIDQVELQAPLPVNVYDSSGTLLLRKGEIIRDEAHKMLLKARNPMAEAEEFRQWTFRYTSAIDRQLRSNARLKSIAGVTRPMGVESVDSTLEHPMAERWFDLHEVLSLLQHQGATAHGFLQRLHQFELRLLDLLGSRIDDSLFLLVQMLQDKTLGMYIPGSYVKLANGEIGVVVRRGRKANAPLVFALVSSQGMPLGEPILRDTLDPGLEVGLGLVADEVKVRMHPARLLARL